MSRPRPTTTSTLALITCWTLIALALVVVDTGVARAETTVFSDSFTTLGNWSAPNWSLDTQQYSSGPSSAHGSVGNLTLNGPMNLSTRGGYELRFRRTSSGLSIPYSQFHVSASHDGSAWEGIGAYVDNPTWRLERCNLDAFAGDSSVYFQFGALSMATPSIWIDDFRVVRLGPVERVAGLSRYTTAVKASQAAFASANTVVLATGANWPDALGGSALAGAVNGPLLLTQRDVLPLDVQAEISRLGASKIYILGSTAAVSTSVENGLVGHYGRANVIRLGGANRYETARTIADETIAKLPAYGGHAFVATGANFPDAAAAAPLAASLGRPILLTNPTTDDTYVPPATTRVRILGATGAVSSEAETKLNLRLGAWNVIRIEGANRYDTAAKIAAAGVAAGLHWTRVGLATGKNFPDALAGGAMLGAQDNVLLLTNPYALSTEAQLALQSHQADIGFIQVFGQSGAVSESAVNAAMTAAGF